jgi:hypothetical protein
MRYVHGVSVTTWTLTAALVAATPVPGDRGDEALERYDHGAYLEAASLAMASYVSPAIPAARRLHNARLAQGAYARAYEEERLVGSSRPELLCQALDVLDATALLVVREEDVERHRKLTEGHRGTLAAQHPAHRCEVGTAWLPIPATTRPRPPAPVVIAEATISRTPAPRARATTPFRVTGAVSLSLGMTGLIVMAGGLAVRGFAVRAGEAFRPAESLPMPEFAVSQVQLLAELRETAQVGQTIAIAGGISGGALLTLGTLLLVLGRTKARRTQISPSAGIDRIGVVLEGRF